MEAFEAELVDALGKARHKRLLKSLDEMRTIVGELESVPAGSRSAACERKEHFGPLTC